MTETPDNWRRMRLLAPNLVTAASLVFGMLSLVAAHEGRHVEAAWFIVYAVLADRLDGLVARKVQGESELGIQLDSFADFQNFGIAPAFLLYSSLSRVEALPFAQGSGRTLLLVACATWVLGATFRLARYNISSAQAVGMRMFFGIPSTLAAGTLIVWYLLLVKYLPAGAPLAALEPFGGPKLFGDWESPTWVWRYAPGLLFAGGFLMASNLRMPGTGGRRSKVFTIFVLVNVILGYITGIARVFPEYMVWPPTMWIVDFLGWGLLSREAGAVQPPPLFPPPKG